MILGRRHFFTMACAAVLSAPGGLARSAAPERVPVRLLVLRRPGIAVTNACVAPCIRGRIYDISDLRDVEINQLVLPALRIRLPICDTIERPYRGNRPNVSSIPSGVYSAGIRDDATKNWM